MAKPLVLWGYHPAHGNVPMKLEEYTQSAMDRRQREGWTVAVYAQGDEPVGLKLQADAANKKLPTVMGDLKLGAAKSCPPGFILRKAYTTKRGVPVARGCVPDTGKAGKTPPSGRILPKPEPGGLKGWAHDASQAQRHAALKKVSEADGCGTALKRLNLLANFTKTTSPATHKAARRDMQWLKKQGFCSLKKR